MDELPRLSQSIAKIGLSRSWAHAHHAHRLLGGGGTDESSKAKDTGKVLEALIYGAPVDSFVIIDAEDFRKKEAKEQRDKAYDDGKTPVLASDWAEFKLTAEILKGRLADQGVIFQNGEYQKKIEWACSLTGANCKGFLDYYNPGIIWDLKTCQDASPAAVWRSVTNFGYDVQYAAYTDGIETLYPELVGRSRFIFAFCEVEAPFAVQLYELSERKKDIGRNKWHYAKCKWVECLETGVWPSYFTGVGIVEAKKWENDFTPDVTILEED